MLDSLQKKPEIDNGQKLSLEKLRKSVDEKISFNDKYNRKVLVERLQKCSTKKYSVKTNSLRIDKDDWHLLQKTCKHDFFEILNKYKDNKKGYFNDLGFEKIKELMSQAFEQKKALFDILH